MYATLYGYKKVVQILMPHEIGVQMKSKPYSAALTSESDTIVINPPSEQLGANIQNSTTLTPLIIATWKGYLDIVKILVPHETDVWCNQRTAMLTAAQYGHKEIVDFLAPHEKGAMDSSDLNKTALMKADVLGDMKAIELLIKYEKNLKTEDRFTALMHAAFAAQQESIKFFFKHEKKASQWTDLMYAAAIGDAKTVKKNLNLCKQGDNFNHTALMVAAANGQAEAVKILVEHEAGLKQNNGWTALMFAAKGCYAVCVKLLLKHEGGLKTESGLTALMLATQHGHVGICNTLLETEKRLVIEDGTTALMYASMNGHPEVAQMLAESESGMVNKDSATALILGTEQGHLNVIKVLLPYEKGMKSNKGNSAMSVARALKDTEIIAYLTQCPEERSQ